MLLILVIFVKVHEESRWYDTYIRFIVGTKNESASIKNYSEYKKGDPLKVKILRYKYCKKKELA